MPGGRPTDYTSDLGDIICQGIAKGSSMVRVCENDDDLPEPRTVYRWLREHTEFRQNYEKAKEDQADRMVEEMLEIADDGSNDWMEANKPGDEGYKANGEHIQRSRLRLDARKWVASKFKAKKYGDKITTEHTGTIGVTDLTEDQLDARIKALAGKE